ncbi:carbohydrate kinase family protein [Methylicorpusculum sp.]|uniref:carbohydrate kinase family protein n=1 Tax=Methylicorpusculum sp. TaxID=2713644 RepID=UPI00272EF1F2|nr:PfkB family carbohydrate kinase [Methylicorpusculum sp.]MDP2178237.1 PfkB family carbohydrate kinase [Methylicorpusculum sp.]MDP3530552.1 PfkB family carbohydrate kinase [Methylicorpusculum sp.]MDZ4151588.1 PfkB family carbohydrate kinase [Methylicorpusculum sp.]
MFKTAIEIDVLCVGHACYDLVFSVPHHPKTDEKLVADSFISCGGGPAANAAITVSLLGLKAGFAGYLGHDIYGEKHVQELIDNHVNTDFIVRGSNPTPLSTVIVKPDGSRALINFKGNTQALAAGSIDFSTIRPRVILFDGHEPHVSMPLAHQARKAGIATVLDAGSIHEGTLGLMPLVDHLVCSEKFARQYAGDTALALNRLAEFAPSVVITLGEQGLIWRQGQQQGSLPAFQVEAIDTTGAGDAFHGAFAAGLCQPMPWHELLHYASATGALCTTKTGARTGLPDQKAVSALLAITG